MFNFLFTWYNLPFTVALGCCLVFAVLQVLGSDENDSDADADVDSDIDTDIDADADVDVDVDADADVDVDADADVDADVDGAGGVHGGDHDHAPGGLLALLGIGTMPLMLVLTALLGGFGAAGLLLNALLSGVLGGYQPLVFLPALVLALVLALTLSNRISRVFARVAPNISTAVGYQQLVGRMGTVVSATISPTYGRVQVRDSFGALQTVFAVLESDTPLREGSEVALIDYDEAKRHYVARPFR